MTYIEDIEDDNTEHVRPIVKLTKEDIRAFFEAKIRDTF